ncbi:MAG: Hsp33 family molecular chaperone HslO [Rhodobacteraceae bacterium]|nr:Hsp33 family molecular chaperone HslO [Paracoccaceae bacterium]
MDQTNTPPQAAPPGDDSVLPFQLDQLDLRGRVVRLDKTLDQIMAQHRYPPSVCALVAEAALITALIGQAMKLRGRFSVQARGESAIKLIATDYYAPSAEGEFARLRAYAQFDPKATPDVIEDPYSLIGEGLFAMTIDQGRHMAPYQGLTPLVSGGLAACAETYFAQSEQIATRFHLAFGESAQPGGPTQWRAGGVMLQHLAEFGEGAQPLEGPSGEDGLLSPQDIAEMGDRAEDWGRANILLDTVEDLELIGPHVSPETLLWRLFHEEQPRVYPPQPIHFGCTCQGEKVETLLTQYPEAELREMATDTGEIVADCQFCGAQYRFPLNALLNPIPPAQSSLN